MPLTLNPVQRQTPGQIELLHVVYASTNVRVKHLGPLAVMLIDCLLVNGRAIGETKNLGPFFRCIQFFTSRRT